MDVDDADRNFLEELDRIYRELDGALARVDMGDNGNPCKACTQCCRHNYRFPVGSLELAYMEERGMAVSPEFLDFLNGRIKSPNGSPPLCPQSTPRGCTVYSARPMCCRLYGFAPYRELLPHCVYIPVQARHPEIWETLLPLFRRFLNLRAAHYAAVSPSPRTLTDFLDMGLLALDAGDFKNALSQIQAALALNPRDPRAHSSLGHYHARRSEGDKALIHFQDSLELDPADFNTHVALGGLYGAENQWEKALVHYDRARELDPGQALHWLLSGQARFGLGRTADGCTCMEKALALGPAPDMADLIQNYLALCTRKA